TPSITSEGPLTGRAGGALQRAERIEDTARRPAQRPTVARPEPAVHVESQLAEQETGERRPGQVDGTGSLRRGLEAVFPGDGRAGRPCERAQRRASALACAQVDLGPERRMAENVDGPRIAIGLEE